LLIGLFLLLGQIHHLLQHDPVISLALALASLWYTPPHVQTGYALRTAENMHQ
jgi:hypothetical protein